MKSHAFLIIRQDPETKEFRLVKIDGYVNTYFTESGVPVILGYNQDDDKVWRVTDVTTGLGVGRNDYKTRKEAEEDMNVPEVIEAIANLPHTNEEIVKCKEAINQSWFLMFT